MKELRDQVFVFTGATFEAALADWMREQIDAYPHQEERIRIAALAMRDFLLSDAARRHKMLMRPERTLTPSLGTVPSPHGASG